MTNPVATVTDRRYRVRIALDARGCRTHTLRGFSKEYGARKFERVPDRLLGSLVAEALSGKIPAGQTIRLEAIDGRIQVCQSLSL